LLLNKGGVGEVPGVVRMLWEFLFGRLTNIEKIYQRGAGD
jgi:hypothetical protein